MAIILVVEDNAALRQLICRYLARRGHVTIPAGTGADAVKRAASRRPGIALLDLRLPDTDGLSLFQTLRRNSAELIGVIMTAYGSVPNAVRCLRAGIAEYLEKPFELDVLSAMIEQLASRGGQASTDRIESSGVCTVATQLLGLAIVHSLNDQAAQKSVATWGHAIGTACSTLRMRCEAAHVSPKAAHDFRRGLAADIQAAATGGRPGDFLGYSDERSIRRFLSRCGALQDNGRPWTLTEYCRLQQVLRQPAIVAEVLRLLRVRGLVT